MPATHHQHAHLRTPPGVIAGIIGVSAAASALHLLAGLLPCAHRRGRNAPALRLPMVNAVLNALAAIALVTGFREIRQRRILHHRASMSFAFGPMDERERERVNYTLHGETHLPIAHTGALSTTPPSCSSGRTSRWPSSPCPWLIITFFLSLTGRFPAHKRLARSATTPSGSMSRSAAVTSTCCRPSSADAQARSPSSNPTGPRTASRRKYGPTRKLSRRFANLPPHPILFSSFATTAPLERRQMAKGVNKVFLLGNVGKDPEFKVTQSGMQIATLASPWRSTKGQDGN